MLPSLSGPLNTEQDFFQGRDFMDNSIGLPINLSQETGHLNQALEGSPDSG